MYIENSGLFFPTQSRKLSSAEKKAGKICLVSIKFKEAIVEPQAILELPSSINLNLQLVYLQWSEQVTFLPRN